jgi:pectin methylesterase-like acyl-CoA thioesterase
MNLKTILTPTLIIACYTVSAQQNASIAQYFPKQNAVGVNPDTHLVLTFKAKPQLGNSGKIRIYDAITHQLVDSLDMSIPAGPTTRDTARVKPTPKPYEYVSGHFTNANTKPGTPSGMALPNFGPYQLTIIGGFTDGFHFNPIIIHDNTATIYPHNNLLTYNKSYYVTIDRQVFGATAGFEGINPSVWKFSTKKSPPNTGQNKLVVSADGTADFNTVQGAIDLVPENNRKPVIIFIRNGTYEEIVYFRKKSNITFIGEDREKTIVTYNNYEALNPHPKNLGTNELPGTFPSRRAAFMGDNCDNISIANMSILNPSNQQAEGLLLTGEHNMLYHINVRGGGDALQINGAVYMKESRLDGLGDAILGRGAGFFDHCDFYSRGAFMWIRNTAANHGNVFINSTFHGTGTTPTEIAREPSNGGKTYPYSEAVLINCRLENISPAGWGKIDGDPTNIHYWEYNSRNVSDNKPVDIGQRHPLSKQLLAGRDDKIIADYSNPAFVLGGWAPPINNLVQTVSKMLAGK